MGKLYDLFKTITFANEAEVSQNFILPLLKRFLGYVNREIVPEKYYPTRNIFSGVNFAGGGSKGLTHRPDYVICIDGDYEKVRFIIDSKGPNENIQNHLGQLRSYATSVGQNFLMITNGHELMVYDVNALIFHSTGIEDLQLKLDELKTLIGRENQISKSSVEILKEFNFDKAVANAAGSKTNAEIQKRKIQLCDFSGYLDEIIKNFTDWHLPTSNFKAINNLNIQKLDPNHLLSFRLRNETAERDEKVLKFPQIESDYNVRKKVFVGETGTGKTSLLKFIALKSAENAQNLIDVKIPVYIALKEIGLGYNLEQLASAALRRYGYGCQTFENLGTKNQFIFLLDAFDEVAETFRDEVCDAVENLSKNYYCYITTRPNAVPELNTAATFDVLPLTDNQVEMVARQYMGSNYYHFQQQIQNNDLVTESRNTLLLFFLISLYIEQNHIPNTASKVIRAMIERIKSWQDHRRNKTGNLKWESLSEIMARLAFWIFENDTAAITIAQAEPIIEGILAELEKRRRIPAGITIDAAISSLTATGLVIANNYHLYFWHRLFLNHFAAISLRTKVFEDTSLIAKLSVEERWDIVIISMVSTMEDITPIVEQLGKRLWLAAYCLIENENCSQELTEKVVITLSDNIDSPVQDIRSRAISFLEGINNTQAQNFLLQSFEHEQYEDVTMMTLAAIAKNGTPEAKKIIDRYIDWDEWSFFQWRSSQAYVVQALSNYGEEGHQQIITNWEKYSNYPMNDACKRIFLRLHNTSQLSQSLVERLQHLYITEFLADNGYSEKVEALADILAEAAQPGFADKILELPFTRKYEYPKVRSLIHILKSSTSLVLAEKIRDKIFMEGADRDIIENLARALKKIAAPVPKEIYLQLIGHSDVNISCTGLSSLERFPFAEVKEEIDRHLFGSQPQLQSWALKLLVNNGKVINLIRQDSFPSPFYVPTAHTLFEAVRRFHLIEAMPLLYKIQDAIGKEKMHEYESALAFELAGTLNYMGEIERQRQVIALYFDGTNFLYDNERYFQTNLVRKLKYLDVEIALKLAGAFFTRHLLALEKYSAETEVFLEAAEDLGGEWMREKTKAITDQYIRQIKVKDKAARHSIERALRAMTKIGRAEDEDWLLGILPFLDYDSGFEFTQLRRAIECLAHFGTKKSLPIIREIAEKKRLNESIMNVSQFAYNSISRKEKIPIDDRGIFIV